MKVSNNIRSRLFIGFSILMTLIITNLLISSWFMAGQSRINTEREALQKIETMMLDLFIEQLSFIENNFLDSNLYIDSMEYGPLLLQQKRFRELDDRITFYSSEHNGAGRSDTDLIKDIEKTQGIFLEIIALQIEKGFKDWGNIGNMRYFAHQLENQGIVPLADLLSMRMYEKDYLLRKDIIYFDKLKEKLKKLHSHPDRPCSGEYCMYLNGYFEEFKAVVEKDERLGDFYTKGLKLELLKQIEKTKKGLDARINFCKEEQNEISTNIMRLFFFSGITVSILALVISIKVSKGISRPLKALVTDIKTIVNDNDNFHLRSYKGRSYKEISDLLVAFNGLIDKINFQIESINEKGKKLEDQNKKLIKVNKELDYFVYSVSHDIRSPLSSLMGLITITKEEEDSFVKNVYLMKMEELIGRLDRFTSDILDLSRNARMADESCEVDIGKMTKEIFEDIGTGDNMPKVKKELSVMKHRTRFFSDRKRIGIILKNLINNSVKYADIYKDCPYVKVDLSMDDERVLITVSDNGIGIAEEHKAHIFEMFYRGNDRVRGSGLGLYIVKETVERLGGGIGLESKLGEGSSFQIRLPNYKKTS